MCKRILALLCLICSSASWAIQENKTVRFAIGDWEPYTSRQDNPEFKVAETIVRAAFANQGYQVELDYFPWSRAYKYAESGAYDGSFPWMMTPERQTIFLYSKPFFTQHIVFFYHKSSQFDWHSVEDLKKYRIGATQDYAATTLLQKLGITPDIDNEDGGSIIKLGKQRVDTYPAGLERGQYLIKTLLEPSAAAQIMVHPKALSEDYMHILFTRADLQRSEHLSQVFSKGLKALFDSGEYYQIVDPANQLPTDDE
ncbi:amino acid ABC transporter [Vibrio cidicii]|uniref:substrate-binding periplasmic protein n=1 Tax=Vibrio cidicii TaxID=1763883 RepID=UPI0018C1FBC9|nr:transporter substrate-binding domain-containing protein [Vibrio cidicii]MBG0759952.1 amino acid ABC transporter [Vibrio cidicii]